ncbi:hypothetical protein DRO28_02400 [Candidatus Bathyarchaeota archaeon]|nr:MAG: hypothetical protein DRO28_02400 [Candidatus Bathyarchaeota archaeon]
MDTGEIIKDLKEKEKTEPIYMTCCDVLRALTILHGSAWQSDLTLTLEEIWGLKNLTLDQTYELRDKLDEAIKLLNERGLILSGKRVRANLSSSKPTEEDFHQIKDFFTLIREFGSDRYVLRYRREIMGYR